MQENPQLAPSGNDKSIDQRFVELVMDRCQKDKGMAARLRRADNPGTEYQSWEFLGSLGYLGVNLENDYKRLPFVTVAAAISKSKSERNGCLPLGRAIAVCYQEERGAGQKEGRENDQAKARLRRLLACYDLAEVCRILRPLLVLISSKVSQPLDYSRLLRQLRFYGQRTKTEWAQEFYGQSPDPIIREGAL